MDEARLTLPAIVLASVRQGGDEPEIRQCCGVGRELRHEEQVRPGACAVEEADRTLLAAGDVVAQDRPERRHPGAAADQDQRPGAPLAAETGAVWPFGDDGVAGLEPAGQQRGEGAVRILLDDEVERRAAIGRAGHRVGPRHAVARHLQVDILPGPEADRRLQLDRQLADVLGQRGDRGHGAGKRLHGDGPAQKVLVVVQELDGQVAECQGAAQ